MARLGQRVFDEGEVRLLRFRHLEFALRLEIEAERRQQLGEFFQLAGVIGGKYESLSHESFKLINCHRAFPDRQETVSLSMVAAVMIPEYATRSPRASNQ